MRRRAAEVGDSERALASAARDLRRIRSCHHLGADSVVTDANARTQRAGVRGELVRADADAVAELEHRAESVQGFDERLAVALVLKRARVRGDDLRLEHEVVRVEDRRLAARARLLDEGRRPPAPPDTMQHEALVVVERGVEVDATR